MKTRLIGALLAIVLAAGGAVVLIGYVRTADARAADGAEFVAAYIVKAEIPGGTPAEQIEKYITVKDIPALAAVPGRVTALSELAGQVSEVALKPGEQLITSRWVDPAELAGRGDVPLPAGMQAVTLALPVERAVGGTIRAGDRVGVVVTATVKIGSAAEEPTTKQAFHKMLVLSVQEGTVYTPKTEGSDAPAEPVSALMVTFAGLTADVEKLVWGQENGSVWLTLEPKEATETGSRAATAHIVFE
ncbi:MAG: Flp pilus assembly protein CpaB [Cryobacterium sp.]